MITEKRRKKIIAMSDKMTKNYDPFENFVVTMEEYELIQELENEFESVSKELQKVMHDLFIRADKEKVSISDHPILIELYNGLV